MLASGGVFLCQNRMMNNSEKVLYRLSKSHQMRFTGESQLDGWQREGEATVTTEYQQGRLILSEEGQWHSVNHAEQILLRGKWQLSAQGEEIKIYHLRQGIKHPVFLVSLIQQTPQRWISQSAHLCGEDRYKASLTLSSQKIVIEWKVLGAHKKEQLCYCYTE